jgi:hypothetical protein
METRDHVRVRCPPPDPRDVEHPADPREGPMIDAENDAIDAFSRALGDEAAVLLDRAMLLINELLAIGVDPPAADAGRRLSVKVYPVDGSARIEIRDDGTGVVLGGLRKQQGSASHGWSPHLLSRVADRWGLVSGEDGAWVWFELDLSRGKR